MEEPSFWDDNAVAQKVIADANRLREWTTPLKELQGRYADLNDFLQEVTEESDPSFYNDLLAGLANVEKAVDDLEVRRMLAGELDNNNCYLTINSGAGGTESCDWVLMLSRMYQRWASRKGWNVEVVDVLDGDVAGIKNITMKFCGPFAYGYAKAEKGVHRLVRISPFDSNARRHTSFASVDVSPEITDDIEVDIRPDDIRVDTYRSSGRAANMSTRQTRRYA